MSYTSGIYGDQARRVLLENRAAIPTNTLVAYDNKEKEFIQFCEAKFPSTESGVHAGTVTEETAFGFLYYQTYRKVRKRGRKKDLGMIFDVVDFDRVMFEAGTTTTNPELTVPLCGQPILVFNYQIVGTAA